MEEILQKIKLLGERHFKIFIYILFISIIVFGSNL